MIAGSGRRQEEEPAEIRKLKIMVSYRKIPDHKMLKSLTQFVQIELNVSRQVIPAFCMYSLYKINGFFTQVIGFP